MNLNKKQTEVVGRILADKNTILTGKAGTGKTVTVMAVKKACEAKNIPIIMTASTGIAAAQIAGITIHRALSFNGDPMVTYHDDWETSLKYARGKWLTQLVKEVSRIVLIIDEISMVKADLMDGILGKLAIIKTMTNVTILLSGDTTQLPPIPIDRKSCGSELIQKVYDEYRSLAPSFIKARRLAKWQFKVVELTEVYRQADNSDLTWLNLLRTVTSDTDKQRLMDNFLNLPFRVKNVLNVTPDTTVITPVNRVARDFNLHRLNEMEGELVTHYAIGEVPKESLFEQQLEMKVGAKVMVIANDYNVGIFNGEVGQITKIEHGVTSATGTRVTVKIGDDEKVIYPIEAGERYYDFDKKQQRLIVRFVKDKMFIQLPLKLAYAITIHKSQGMTLGKVHIMNEDFLGKPVYFRAKGQLYVALSRARELSDVSISRPFSKGDLQSGKPIPLHVPQAEWTSEGDEQEITAWTEYTPACDKVMAIHSYFSNNTHIEFNSSFHDSMMRKGHEYEFSEAQERAIDNIIEGFKISDKYL